jgi:hypothetical protein
MWFESLLKKGAFFGYETKHGAIMWFLVGGSEFRVCWNDWIIDFCRAGKIISESIQMSFLPKMPIKLILFFVNDFSKLSKSFKSETYDTKYCPYKIKNSWFRFNFVM